MLAATVARGLRLGPTPLETAGLALIGGVAPSMRVARIVRAGDCCDERSHGAARR